MLDLLDDGVEVRLRFAIYRWRFFLAYVVIGVVSLLLEFAARRLWMISHDSQLAACILGVGVSILVAYWLNVRFNFKVPTAKRRRAFFLFVLISLLSLTLNLWLQSHLAGFRLPYEQSRLLSSGLLFSLAYLLHRRFSFHSAKQVGLAVYANSAEDIRRIHERVGMFPDFIHIDIVDDTFNRQCLLPSTHRLEVVRAYWPGKSLHAHVMSSTPRRWLDDLLRFSDVIILHVEGVDGLRGLAEEIRAAGKPVGFALRSETPLEALRPVVDLASLVLLLTIPEPGRSGQSFQMSNLEKMQDLNQWPERRHFEVCVDGGVNERNIHLLNIEKVVSGASVLNHPDPPRQIMRLQTSSNYEQI